VCVPGRWDCDSAVMEQTTSAFALPAPEEPRAVLADGNQEWRGELLSACLCGGFGLAGVFTSGSTSIGFFVLSYLAGGWFSAQDVWELLKTRVVDVHFLMLLVAAGSASIGGWGEGAVLLFLFSLSGALESYAEGRTEREINSLFKSSPKTARVLRNGVEETVPVEQIVPGLLLLVKPGDLIPVDCELLKGQTACDESTLTGEAAPVEKTIADQLYSGTINLWGAVEAKALRPASQSALSRIIEIIREAQHQKAPAQKFTDRFSSWYTYGVLGAAFVMFFVWWLGLGYPPFKAATGHSAFYRTMTLLVVSSPCALVLSIPSAVLSAIAYGAKRGILFRGGSAVERLADVNVVVMDKTGTVTTGDLKVNAVESFPPGREDSVLALALSVEELSTHPLARAITSYARQKGIAGVPLLQFESVAGAGLRALADGKPLRLGKCEWVLEGGGTPPNVLSASGLTEVWLRYDGLVGRITLQDHFRENARELIDELHRLKLKTVLLTGDRVETAERARTQLGIQEVKGGLKPEEKLLVIGALKRRGARVAMIGDGVNDAPSLAAADVGIAMGARGSDAALEQADIVLMNDQLENLLTALHLSKRAQRVIRENLFVSLGTVVVLVFFALAGRIPLTVGVVGHEGSTVLVVLNSLRLLLREKQ
jgi:Cd2+/Zn2+-exporting ATPase